MLRRISVITITLLMCIILLSGIAVADEKDNKLSEDVSFNSNNSQFALQSYADERWQWTSNGVKQERCTYRVWHEAYDRLGISLPLNWGNAATWASNARSQGVYPVDNNPSPNSIVCWGGGTEGWGHVAYVTGVDNANVYIREAGINPVNGVYYQDTSYSRSNQNRWNGFWLNGYIHLGGTGYVDLGADFYANIAAGGDGHWTFLENNAGNVQLCSKGNDYTDVRQQWHFIRQADGSYHIRNNDGGNYLNADAMETAGTNISVAKNMNWDGQKWYIIKAKKFYNIVPKYNPDLCLDVHNGNYSAGTNIKLWWKNGGGPQIFDIYKYDTKKYPLVENLGSNFYANIAAGGDNHWTFLENNKGNVQLCSKGNDYTDVRHQWHFIRQADGSYHIRTNDGGNYLNADAMETAGTNISVAKNMNWDGQKWYIIKAKKFYNIIPKYNTDLCLDVHDGKYSAGTNIKLWWKNGGEPQIFDIYKYDTKKYPLVENIGTDFYASIAAAGAGHWTLLENNKGNVQLCSSGNDLTDATQQWHFIRQADGSYHILSVNDDKYLNADAMETAGTNISVAKNMNWDGQKWYLIKVGKNYAIAAKYNLSLCLDVKNSDFKLGNNIHLWNRSNNDAQIFDIYKNTAAPGHKHSFAKEWSYDDTYHWHACTATGNNDSCMSAADAAKAEHTYGNSGDARYTCTVCKYVDVILKGITEQADQDAADEAVARIVRDAILVLPAAEDVTIQDEEVIGTTRAAYDALTDSQKSKIDEGLIKYFTDAEGALQAAIESEKNGHSWVDAIVTKEPTCTETGIVKYTCKTCGITKEEEIATSDHTWDEGIVTKQPTCKIDGIRTYTCEVCGYKRNERIPAIKIVSGETTTDDMDTMLTNREDDSDLEGSKFSVLCLKIKKVAKTSHVLTWKKDSHADSYLIYASKCGKKNKLKFIAETTGKTYTHKKLKKGTYYKYIVVAATSDGMVTSVSKMLHSATTGGKVGNAKSVKTAAKKSKVTVKRGKSFKLRAKTVKASSKLTIKVHRGMKYESTNTNIATISAKGVIKGKAKGKCYVYAYAQNGKYARITVTVK